MPSDYFLPHPDSTYWSRTTRYVRFARSIGANVRRIYDGVHSITPLNPVQSQMLDDYRNLLEI